MGQTILTTGQIAGYCGVDAQTVIRWANRGELKAFRLPGRGDHRIELDDFLDFLNRHHMPIPSDLAPPSNRVMIVEDDPDIAKSIHLSLSDRGFESKVAHDAFEAGFMLGAFNPGLIIIDENMEQLDISKAIELIGSAEILRNLCVIVLSDKGTHERGRLLSTGVHCVIDKPFDRLDLVEKVSKFLATDTAVLVKHSSVQ